jgi:hypothetical protein
VFKIVGLTALLIGIGWSIYAASKRRAARLEAAAA